jgi:site-specific DNA-methyltransferase (adenine-specific)
MGIICKKIDKIYTEKNPTSIIQYKVVPPKERLHPTQKPIALLEYLIKTYINENEIVLDNCIGSGSTGVACINTNRNFIGIEKDDKYFEIAKDRIEKGERKFVRHVGKFTLTFSIKSTILYVRNNP